MSNTLKIQTVSVCWMKLLTDLLLQGVQPGTWNSSFFQGSAGAGHTPDISRSGHLHNQGNDVQDHDPWIFF